MYYYTAKNWLVYYLVQYRLNGKLLVEAFNKRSNVVRCSNLSYIIINNKNTLCVPYDYNNLKKLYLGSPLGVISKNQTRLCWEWNVQFKLQAEENKRRHKTRGMKVGIWTTWCVLSSLYANLVPRSLILLLPGVSKETLGTSLSLCQSLISVDKGSSIFPQQHALFIGYFEATWNLSVKLFPTWSL